MTDVPAGDRNAILRHWRDAVPNDRLAHLIRDAGRSLGHRLTHEAVALVLRHHDDMVGAATPIEVWPRGAHVGDGVA